MPDLMLLFRLRVPPHPISVSTARRLVRGLNGWIDPIVIERAELATSELVTNAIRYGSPTAGDEVEIDVEITAEALSVRVRDHGPAFEEPAGLPSPGATGGFGVHVARGVSDSFRIDHREQGNEVALTMRTSGARLLAAAFNERPT